MTTTDLVPSMRVVLEGEVLTRRTWLFLGYWEDSTLHMAEAIPNDDGYARDLRPSDNRAYPEGLWADNGSGFTVEEAWQNAIAEYLDEDGYALY